MLLTHGMRDTYIFDVGARVNSDDVAVLDTEVVADNSVDACAPVIQVVVGEHNQDRVLALFAFYEHSVSSEQL